jgi:YVTN family beta-propeller protein
MENVVRQLSVAFILAFFFGISALGQNVASTPSASLAYVLDPASQTVTAVDLVSGQTKGVVPVNGQATNADLMGDEQTRTPMVTAKSLLFSGVDTLLMTPDGSRLVRIRSGNHKFSFRFGYHPLEKSTASIIDTKTMQVVAQADLGWGLSDYYLTPDKKVLVTLATGYQSQKPEETLPSELIAMDLSSGQVLGRLALQRLPSACVLSKNGATAMLLYAQQKQKGEPSMPAELQFVSMDKLLVSGKVTFDGAPDMPVLSPSGEYVYLLEKGQPSNNPDKNINGRVHVISIKEMKAVADLDAGSDPKGVMADEASGQVLILSNGAPVKGQKYVDGELRILRGASIVSLVKVGAAPRFFRFSPDRKRLYVIGWNELSAIDYTDLHEISRVPLGGFASEFALSPDGNHGFVLFSESSRLLLVDLQALKAGESVTTGRGGVKFAKNLGAIAATAASATAASYQASSMAASNGGVGVGYYQIFTVAPANTSISVRPDGAFVYVLNSETNDVTIVNVSTSAVVDKIAAGGQRFQPLNNGGVLGVVGRNTLHLIDTSTQKALQEVHFDKSLEGVYLSPDGRTALAFSEGPLVLLNGSTGEVRGKIDGFKRPRTVVFAQGEQTPNVSTQP